MKDSKGLETPSMLSADSQKRGRKTKQESRADELRRRLISWKQMPELQRPSLRALARELNTTHQLLLHFLFGLDEWQAKEYWRQAEVIQTVANTEGRSMTPWEQHQHRALNRRAACLYLESRLEVSAKHYEQEIESCIKEGGMPARAYVKLLGTIASIRGGPAAQRAAQLAQAVLQKYFSPEGKRDVRERIKTAPKSDKAAVLKLDEASCRQIRLQKLVERFEEIGGVILPNQGRVCYFIAEETAVSRVLLTQLGKYCEELQSVIKLNPGKVDFTKVKAEIYQRFPDVLLTPLDSHTEKPTKGGNSARELKGERDCAFKIST